MLTLDQLKETACTAFQNVPETFKKAFQGPLFDTKNIPQEQDKKIAHLAGESFKLLGKIIFAFLGVSLLMKVVGAVYTAAVVTAAAVAASALIQCGSNKAQMDSLAKKALEFWSSIKNPVAAQTEANTAVQTEANAVAKTDSVVAMDVEANANSEAVKDEGKIIDVDLKPQGSETVAKDESVAKVV